MKMFAKFAVASLLAASTPVLASDIAVTRFHTPASLAEAAPGPIALRAGAGLEADSIEARMWLDAVAAALTRQGFEIVAGAPRVAEVSLDQDRVARDRGRSGSGVSVGVGVGSGGGWYGRRSGVDLGVGLGMVLGGGRNRNTVATTLSVAIEQPGGAHLWEGRAEATSRAGADNSDTRKLAGEMAARLFSGFPGESGATIGAR